MIIVFEDGRDLIRDSLLKKSLEQEFNPDGKSNAIVYNAKFTESNFPGSFNIYLLMVQLVIVFNNSKINDFIN